MPLKQSEMEIDLFDGVTYEELDESEILEKFYAEQKAYAKLVMLRPYGIVMPAHYMNWDKQVREFEVHDDDVFVATYPKCGKIIELDESLWQFVVLRDTIVSSHKYCIEMILGILFEKSHGKWIEVSTFQNQAKRNKSSRPSGSLTTPVLLWCF